MVLEIRVPNSRVKVLVIPTNEELVVAREVKRFLDNPKTAPSGNPKSEIRNPSSETRIEISYNSSAKEPTSDFGSRASFGFRISDFGFQNPSIGFSSPTNRY